MAITNLGELKTAIRNELAGRTDLDDRIPEWIASAESRTYSRLRVRFMEAVGTTATVAATRTSALPLRWLAGRSAYVSGTTVYRLEYRTLDEYWALHANRPTARPTVFAIDGENFLWGPVPDTAYSIITNYYQRPASLSANADTNGLFTLAPELLKYAAMIDASTYLNQDARAIMWGTLWGQMIDDLNEADKRDRASGSHVPTDRMAQVA